MADLPIKTGQALLTQTTNQLTQDLSANLAEIQAVTSATEFTLQNLVDNIDVNIFELDSNWGEAWHLTFKEILGSFELSALYQQGQFDKVRDGVEGVYDNVSEEASLTREHIEIELDSLFDDVADHVTSTVEDNQLDVTELAIDINEGIAGDIDFINYQLELTKEAIIEDNEITRTIATIEFDGLRGFVANALSTSFDSISSIIGGLGSILEFLFTEAIDLLKSVVDIDENTLKESLKTFYKLVQSSGQEILRETPPTA